MRVGARTTTFILTSWGLVLCLGSNKLEGRIVALTEEELVIVRSCMVDI